MKRVALACSGAEKDGPVRLRRSVVVSLLARRVLVTSSAPALRTWPATSTDLLADHLLDSNQTSADRFSSIGINLFGFAFSCAGREETEQKRVALRFPMNDSYGRASLFDRRLRVEVRTKHTVKKV